MLVASWEDKRRESRLLEKRVDGRFLDKRDSKAVGWSLLAGKRGMLLFLERRMVLVECSLWRMLGSGARGSFDQVVLSLFVRRKG